MNYEEMLDAAIENMPEIVHERNRFEIPEVKGHVEGNKTIITNLKQIASKLHRKPEHLFKFLLKELATPGVLNYQGCIFGAKIMFEKINEKVKKYTEELVICKKCGKPETKLKEESGLVQLSCQGCGEKYPVKTKL